MSMPLDVFLANSQNEINSETFHFSINESELNDLVLQAKPIKNFPTINKISDYYSDCVLNGGEIKNLIFELNKMDKKNGFINLFINFLEKSDNDRAFFFSD